MSAPRKTRADRTRYMADPPVVEYRAPAKFKRDHPWRSKGGWRRRPWTAAELRAMHKGRKA